MTTYTQGTFHTDADGSVIYTAASLMTPDGMNYRQLVIPAGTDTATKNAMVLDFCRLDFASVIWQDNGYPWQLIYALLNGAIANGTFTGVDNTLLP